MFEMAFIQEKGGGRLMQEGALVRDYCSALGLPFMLYTPKRIARRQLPLTRQCFVFGDMDCAHGAMRQLGMPIPDPNYYPPSLAQHLHRRVWRDILGRLRATLQQDADITVFAKPASRAKVFTGRVFSGFSDLYHVGQISSNEPIWCSDVVSWCSEFRVYVNADQIVSIDHYEGDPTIQLDLSAVQSAIADYRRSGEAPVAYGIDFGVLASGETALVEANDGYALGAYKIASKPYSELLFARWHELIGLCRDDGR